RHEAAVVKADREWPRLRRDDGRGVGGRVSRCNPDDDAVTATDLVGERQKVRHLAFALSTPGGPKVDDERPALELGELQSLARPIEARHVKLGGGDRCRRPPAALFS